MEEGQFHPRGAETLEPIHLKFGSFNASIFFRSTVRPQWLMGREKNYKLNHNTYQTINIHVTNINKYALFLK